MREKNLQKANELIKQRKRKILIKRTIVSVVLLIGISVTLCFKLSYFNITFIEVKNNGMVSSQSIIEASKIQKGTNIFYISLKKIKNNLITNPYIENVKIIRKFPSTLVLDVEENKPVFYIEKNNQYIILDSRGKVLEASKYMNKGNLVKLVGLDVSKYSLGQKVTNEKRKVNLILSFSDLISRNRSEEKITSVDISTNGDINVYFSDMLVKVGTSEGLQNKLDDAIDIISQQNLKDKKGYIDISYKGNPVIYLDQPDIEQEDSMKDVSESE